MVTLVMFLTGVGVGGCVVWALLSYTALNPASSALPEDSVPVLRILARLEREGFSTVSSQAVLAAGRRHSGDRSRPALDSQHAGAARVKGPSAHV